MSKVTSAPIVALRSEGAAGAPPSFTPSVRSCGLVQGTMIETAAGPKPVEQIRSGDFVRVFFRRGLQFEPVEWIRKRTVILSRANKLNLPVRVRPHAIADGRPSRNLYMAPGHATLYEGKLYRIGDLVNGGSILFESRWKSATYWGVKLARHNAVYAEDMLVETLLPDNEMLFTEASPQADAGGRAAEDQAAKTWDLAAEIKDLLLMARPMLTKHGGRVELAAQNGLRAGLPVAAFRGLLLEMLIRSVQAAPRQQLLLAIIARADKIHLTITTENQANRQRMEDGLSDVQAIAAVQGALLRLEILTEGQISLTLSLMAA